MSIFGNFLVRIFPHLLRIHSKCGKIRTRKTPNTDNIHAVIFLTWTILLSTSVSWSLDSTWTGKVKKMSLVKVSSNLSNRLRFCHGSLIIKEIPFYRNLIQTMSLNALTHLLPNLPNYDALKWVSIYNLTGTKKNPIWKKIKLYKIYHPWK